MHRSEGPKPPRQLAQILRASSDLGFSMASDLLTGSLLRTLAASKPGARVLEIGTGTGIATAWLLDGMDSESRLITVDSDQVVVSIAKQNLGDDKRATFLVEDAGAWLETIGDVEFDLIFADAWPGKYSHLGAALDLLKNAGLYVVDDMLPQPNWPEGHEKHVARLVSELEDRADLLTTSLEWSTGIVLATKCAP